MPAGKFPGVGVPDVVVIGTYPPLPGPGTAATLAAVRRAWGQGASVAMVAYRTAAAPLTVPVSGPLAGRRLAQVSRHFGGPPQVAVSLEKGVPFSDPRPWAPWATAAGLALAFRKFSVVSVVVAQDPGVPRGCLALLALGGARFSVPDEQLARRLARRYHLPASRVQVEEVAPFPPVPPGSGDAPVMAGIFSPGSQAQLRYVDLDSGRPLERARQRVRARIERLPLGPARRVLRRH